MAGRGGAGRLSGPPSDWAAPAIGHPCSIHCRQSTLGSGRRPAHLILIEALHSISARRTLHASARRVRIPAHPLNHAVTLCHLMYVCTHAVDCKTTVSALGGWGGGRTDSRRAPRLLHIPSRSRGELASKRPAPSTARDLLKQLRTSSRQTGIQCY